ncbi:ribulose-phosphate 3-epimerase [Acidaminobacter hydrogenoformans DSM 2784]|uniref:Ribulose-phosphate 3-epimerase n=1 Tax=Acidaminobacter hydrogenoformans DSM 2784 TaxID=1120920 RepID=A0A1G5RSA1_9FIRM|nr:ribulose-phosphate 3-epimerase [Acidaminobacter hydrogenoformans]SCZ76952.1 ribulose-phosphate 3-epimerase [Acidaminobacter hydrogenoformans DSM 2784]
MKLAPSILSADFGNLQDEVIKIERSGCEYLHVDVMDGHFVPNLTIGPLVLEALKGRTRLVKDVHLMIEHPERYAEAFAKAGADIITVHQEATVHLHRTIQLIKSLGVKAGVSLNPATPVAVLEDILPDLDLVLIMSVNPGFGGQAFIPQALEKVAKLKSMVTARGLNLEIEVDGGIKADNVAEVVRAGADVIVAGSALFGASDFEAEVQKFRTAVK